MDSYQRLSDRLNSANKYGPEDVDWYHFVLDHKDYLRSKSITSTHTPEELIKYRYRPLEFFKNFNDTDDTCYWIFLFINDIRDPSEFNESRWQFLLPRAETIRDLYRTYSSSVNRSNV